MDNDTVDVEGDLEITAGNVSVLVCHRQLSEHASIFGHMWAGRRNPSLPKAKVVIRQSGSALVHYVQYALGALRVDFTERLDYPLLNNLFEMGRAFGDEKLTTLIINEVMYRFPTTLTAWGVSPPIEDGLGYGGFGDSGPMLDAVAFLENHGFQAAMPAALYDICRYSTPREVAEGVLRADGTRSMLSGANQTRCFRAMAELRDLSFLYTYQWLNMAHRYRRCTGESSCDNARSSLRDRTWGATHNIHAFDEWNKDWSRMLCNYCARKAMGCHQAGRQEVWRMLPKVLGLDEWEVLESHQREKLLSKEVPVYDYTE